MANTPIQESVLSDALLDVIGDARVKSAVFFTFQFDPGFFEQEILPLLFEQSFSHIPKIRQVQLEERLREVEHLAVYYDRQALAPDAQGAQLDYARLALSRASGYFHPKNILLLLEREQDDKIFESLLVGTLSANLTRSGWWENLEVADIREIRAGDSSSLRRDLLEFILRVKQHDETGYEHQALDAIRRFLVYHVNDSERRSKSGHLQSRLFYGQETLPNFLRELIQPDDFNLEIISPYFDASDATSTVQKLIEATEPREIRIFIPEAKDGTALTREAYFDALEQLPRVRWGRLTGDLIKLTSAKGDIATRFVHAKVYRFWKSGAEPHDIYFIGSVNLTQAAHSRVNSGNFETGILIDEPVAVRPMWWLVPVGDDRPTEFHTETYEDEPTAEPVEPLSIRFDWARSALEYFWESRNGNPQHRAEISASGILQFNIEPINFNSWLVLPDDAASNIQQLLRSTSIVQVRVDGGEPFRILIREESMAQKPSLLFSLTVEEILRYWSFLSPEQREAFLTFKMGEGTEGTGIPQDWRNVTTDSLFDRFAGIFHAFGRLEQHIKDALEQGHGAEANYRLFGKKYDSLPVLIEKAIEDEDKSNGARVNRYVTLLCARQVVERLKKKTAEAHPDFYAQHRGDFDRLTDELCAIDRVRAGFDFGTPEETEKFLSWFERMFLSQAVVPEAENTAR